jgi:NADPH-dependent curcumin reductase CurA
MVVHFMFPTRHRQVLLAVRPLGIPQSEHFKIVEAPILPLRSGELLIRNEFLSVEPAMRGWVNAAANYSDPVAVGDVMDRSRRARSWHRDTHAMPKAIR